MQLLALFALITLSQATFWDTECPKYKCTKEELSERNYAKSLSYGNFTCIQSIAVMNPDGTFNQTFSLTSSYQTFYDETKGAIVTVTSAGYSNEEYCGHDKGICLSETEPSIADFYTESYDVSKGPRGNAARFIQSYEKDKNKGVRRIQHLMSRRGGDENLLYAELDENQTYTVVVVLTCQKQ